MIHFNSFFEAEVEEKVEEKAEKENEATLNLQPVITCK